MATEPSLIEVGVITAHGLGTVLPCINWRGAPIAGLTSQTFRVRSGAQRDRPPSLHRHVRYTSADGSRVPAVTLAFEPAHAVRTATTATGAPVAMARTAQGFWEFTLDLEVAADAIVLRP